MSYYRRTKAEKARLKRIRAADAARRAERRKEIKTSKTFVPTIGPQYRRNDVSHIPSVISKTEQQKATHQHLSPEMAERERIAQIEIQHKKKCTAPAYNKGAYQYVATEEQAKDVGR